MASIGIPGQQPVAAVRRLMRDGVTDPGARLEALLALTEGALWVAWSSAEGRTPWLLASRCGGSFLPVFTSPDVLDKVGHTAGWLGGVGVPVPRPAEVVQVLRWGLSAAALGLIVDPGTGHGLVIARAVMGAWLEGLIGAPGDAGCLRRRLAPLLAVEDRSREGSGALRRPQGGQLRTPEVPPPCGVGQYGVAFGQGAVTRCTRGRSPVAIGKQVEEGQGSEPPSGPGTMPLRRVGRAKARAGEPPLPAGQRSVEQLAAERPRSMTPPIREMKGLFSAVPPLATSVAEASALGVRLPMGLVQQICDALQACPEVAWAVWLWEPDEVPAIGLRVDGVFLSRVADFSDTVANLAAAHGLELSVMVLHRAEDAERAARDGVPFYAGQERSVSFHSRR